ncbi:MAG: rhodanese-like domain-containing protein [Fimbriimonadaceae bacterium]|nr:rhodanese-like domain-containing protein [Chitinophagales bacterium]
MDITSEELKQRIDNKEDLFIIDVREPHEYAEMNIGAENIPLGTLPMKLYDFDDKKEDEIIVHCRSGSRSSAAKALLEQSGFKNVRNLVGGILGFKEKFPQ